jgi:hypothetical protein
MGNPEVQLPPSERTPTPEVLQDHQRVAILTSTQYKGWLPLNPGEQRNIDDTDGVRGDLALHTARQAIQLGYKIVVVDGTSSPEFQHHLKTMFEDAQQDPHPTGEGIFVARDPEDSMSGAQRRGLNEAVKLTGVDAIVWTEPEKTPLIPLLDKALDPVLHGEADVVVIERNQQKFKESYPGYMYESEIKGNKWFNAMLKKAGLRSNDSPNIDFYFIPKVFRNKKSVTDALFAKYEFENQNPSPKRQTRATIGETGKTWDDLINPENYSDFRFFPIAQNLIDGNTVVGVEVDFDYPATQLANETTDNPTVLKGFEEKRFMQRVELTRGLKHFIRLHSTDKASQAKSQLKKVA